MAIELLPENQIIPSADFHEAAGGWNMGTPAAPGKESATCDRRRDRFDGIDTKRKIVTVTFLPDAQRKVSEPFSPQADIQNTRGRNIATGAFDPYYVYYVP